MLVGSSKHTDNGRSQAQPSGNRRYAWKEQTYVVPTPSRKGFQWKASALRSLQRISKAPVTGNPATVVVPALYNFMPAEAVALGWLNEIDTLGTIRHRIIDATKLTGWDVFTFHTRHNLDPFYASTIAAVRDTWLHEGSLTRAAIAETVKRYGKVYEYNRVAARLVENLVFQSSIIEWLSARAGDAPLRFHVVGTALLSAAVWSGALSFENAVCTAVVTGTRWDKCLTSLAEDELKRSGAEPSDENLGWVRFGRVRQLLEGRLALSLGMADGDIPQVEAPCRPFWFSATAKAEPVLIETACDVRAALESMDLASWGPQLPKPLPTDSADRIRGWLVSPSHPIAVACRWSVYNYLLATPTTSLLFLDHIASLCSRPSFAPHQQFQERLRLTSTKV